MANAAQLTTAEYTARFNDQMSQGANAAARAMEKLGQSSEVVEQRARRVGQSFEALEARLDSGARLALAKSRADETLARQVERLNIAVEQGRTSQERANQLITQANSARDVYIARVQRQIAVEEQRNQALVSGIQQTNSFAAANDNAGRSSGRFGQAMGQAGFQIQDFATQVSMGQNAMTAFGVQFAQFAGIFGTTGAIAGAVVTVGLLASQFLFMGENAQQEIQRIERNFAGMKSSAEEVKTVIAEINNLFLTAAERSAQAANMQVEEMRRNAERLMEIAIQRNEGNVIELQEAQRERARIEAQLSAEESRNAAGRRRGQLVPVDLENELRSRLFTAQSRITGLETDIARQSTRIGELNDALARARNAGVVTPEEANMPPAPDYRAAEREAREAERAAREAEREAQRERDRIAREEERARQEAIRAEERALQERERLNRQTTDEIVRYSADRFADLWSNTGRGFAGLMESMLQMVRRTFARIAAEAIIRPIVQPIVSNVVTPLMSAFGFGGTAGAGGAGGVAGAAGGLSGIGSFLPSLGGIGAGISGFLAAPLFGQAALASSTNAALAALPGGMLGPAVPSSLGLGGVTVGGFLGGAGAGFGAGMLTSSLVGGMRGTVGPGGMIGAGGGALAGAIIGSIIPGIGTLAGGLIGGAAGGGLGALFGPTRGGMASRAGGDVFLGVDENGQLIITSARGKRWDQAGATAEVQQQLNAINQAAGARGLSFAGAGQAAIGFGAASGSPRELQQAALIAQLRSGNANQMTAFGTLAGRGGTLEQAFAAADFVTQVYEPLGKAVEQTSAFKGAMDALAKTYDEATKKAQELGLSESGLVAQRAERIAKLEADRARDLDIIDRTMAARRAAAGGDTRSATLTQFDLRAEAELRAFGDQLFNLGLERTGDEYRRRVVELEQVIADERLAVMRQYDQQMRGISQGLLESLTMGDLGGLPLEARYGAALSSLSAAQRPLMDGATPQELAEFARVAQIALPIAKEFLGVSGSFAELVADVARTLNTAAPGSDPANLGALLEAQVAGADRLELAVIGTGQAQTEVLRSLLSELKRLTAQNEALLARAST
ncbi:MAG: hypothetical protein ING08_08200 [Roseomonas sp.]|nr:hypothetical protein [Roseomonas sp.]